ncbi:hypothetical protein [Fusobacterium hominis]|uniref:hypothetical protein n=1 Tax=Fusobacterium hominis TaxID=2764326 RepID=UPI0022E0A98A|nr:hypothetical protein [Fusobacterium hominis]
MKKFFKFFIEKEKNIVAIPYLQEDQKKYFRFVKEQYEKGSRQIIITSKIMLKVLEEYFLNKKFRIVEIKFAEEDLELNQEIEKYLEEVEKDRGCFFKLLNKLEVIANNSSIDIEKIELVSSKRINEAYTSFSLKVNGIVIIDGNTIENDINSIIKNIKENIYS